MPIQSALQEITFTVTIKQMRLLSIFTWRWTPEQINLYVDAFIPEIFITTEQTTTSFLKKKFLQVSMVRLQQCPLLFKYSCKTRRQDVYGSYQSGENMPYFCYYPWKSIICWTICFVLAYASKTRCWFILFST